MGAFSVGYNGHAKSCDCTPCAKRSYRSGCPGRLASTVGKLPPAEQPGWARSESGVQLGLGQHRLTVKDALIGLREVSGHHEGVAQHA